MSEPLRANASGAEKFENQGFYIARGLFSEEETDFFKSHYLELSQQESTVSDRNLADEQTNDPLLQYPRQMMMHRTDEVSLDYLCDPRIGAVIHALTGHEPFAVQTMFYFKPPQARGQALHQDNFYLRAEPSTCIAAWLAVDDCDSENGCLTVVPGSHKLPVLCLTPADTNESFTNVTVPMPPESEAVPMLMKAGDVLFFHGQLIHGSGPNRSQDRFRRSLIAHYVLGDCKAVSHWYHPVLRMDKTPVEFGVSEGGGKCGEFVDVDGRPKLEMRDPREADLQMITE
jgi:phytanoyl-CoA hydroxylase